MEAVMEEIQIDKYPSYKDAGAKWLGDIPEHWEIRRLKFLFKEINEKSIDGNEELLSVSHYTGVTKKRDNVEDGDLLTNASTLEGYKKVYQGDLVSNIMLAWNGSLGFSPYNGITSPAYSIYRLLENNSSRYFHYLLRTDIYKSEFKRNSSGVIESRLRLYSDDFFRIISILPPKAEQTAIAQFLDRKTALIDQAIDIKEKQIELLKERRQILIHKAVTRGLNPNVKMKDSGVEWIGQIPEHWEISALSYLARIDTGATPDRTRPGYWNGKIPWVKTGEVKYELITETEEYITENGLKNSATRLAPEGTILMAMYGQGVTRGRVAILGVAATYNQACCAILFNNRIANIYGYYFFIAAYPNVRDAGNETSQMNLSSGYISKLKMPIPPKEEQILISEYIEFASQKIAVAISLKEKEIEKLKEYKATLINSTVTGKIKVS